MTLSKAEKQNISKIKRLIRSRDFSKIETGIELVRALDNPNIFNELLGNVEYKKDEWSGTFTHDWKGTGPDQHYFLTAILGLINYAPKVSKGYRIRESVTILKLRGEISSGYAHETSKLYIKYLSNYLNLKYLVIERFQEIVGFEKIYNLPIEGLEIRYAELFPNHKEKWGFKKLKRLHIHLPTKEDVNHLNFLSEIRTLETLKAIKQSGYQTVGFSIDGLKDLNKLGFLSTYRLGYTSLNSIKSLKKLSYVKLYEVNLECVSGLTSSKNLEFINLSGCKKLSDISALNSLSAIKLIDLSSTSVKVLKGLENSANLLGVRIVNTPVDNLDALLNAKKLLSVAANQCGNLKNIKGLKNAKELRELLLHKSNSYEEIGSLKSLEGIENCLELRVITFSQTEISNLDSLINCKKIFRNKRSRWNEEIESWNGNNEDPFRDVINEVSKVGYGNIIQAEYFSDKGRNYYKETEWSDSQLNEFSITECPNLESVEGLKNAGIQLLEINNCPKIKNIDYLAEFTLLQCCDFTDCGSLESVKALGSLPLVDRLILKKCYKVKPKPRFLMMDSFEKTNVYLSKFKKTEGTIKIDSNKEDIAGKLERLLLENDYSNIDLGLDLANSISDIDIFNFLLQDVKYLNERLIPNSKFIGHGKTKEYRNYALEGLISIAPDTCSIATNIKKNFTKKTLEGKEITSLLSVSGLTNLEVLIVKNTSISTVANLSRLINLKKIFFENNSELNNLSGIKGLINLSQIAIRDCMSLKDLSFIDGFNKLVALQVNNCGLVSTQGLSKLPLLKNINLNDNSSLENIDTLGQLNSLQIITINGCNSLKNIKALSFLSNLSFLRLGKHNLQNTEDLSSLIKPLIEGLRKEK
jgi:hypothetical protein